MKAGFEHGMRELHALAIADAAPRSADAAAEASPEADIGTFLRVKARVEGVGEGTYREVFEIQGRKAMAMVDLHAELQEIDARYGAPEGAVSLPLPLRAFEEPTLGELVADLSGGEEVREAPAYLSRAEAKRYAVERHRRRIARALDNQILAIETDRLDRQPVPPPRLQAYRAIAEARANGESGERLGDFAERLARGIFFKIVFDVGAPDLAVHEADVHQDVDQKIDFWVERKKRGRGVRIETAKEAEGVQLTINPTVVEHKKQQIEHAKRRLAPDDIIKDVVLVLLSDAAVRDAWRRVERGEVPASAADYLLPDHVTRGVIRHVLGQGLFTIAETDAFASSYRDQAARRREELGVERSEQGSPRGSRANLDGARPAARPQNQRSTFQAPAQIAAAGAALIMGMRLVEGLSGPGGLAAAFGWIVGR